MLAVVALTVALRLPGIDRPLVGPFATKNVVYAMIARNWAEGRASAWYPTLDCLVGGRRSLHMLEWPFSAYLSGGLWRVFGGSLDVWGRATAVAFSAASVALMLLLVRRWHGASAAVGAAVALALSPVAVLYGRAFMLEASLVFFTLATFYALDRWLGGGRIVWLVCAAAALALLLLTKIYMLVVLLPLGVMLVWRRARVEEPVAKEAALTPNPSPASGRGELYEADPSPVGGRGERRTWLALAAVALAVLPAAAWYWHAARTAAPESPLSPYVYYSVRSSAEVHRPPHPVLGTADFYRQILDDLAGVVLMPVGLMLMIAGLLDPAWRRHAAWLLAMAVLVAALPLKFYEMSYYWLAVLPPLAVMVGLGWQTVYRGLQPSCRAVAGLLLVALAFSARYTVRPMLVMPQEDRAVPAAAEAVGRLAEPEEPVVAMHGSTPDLLYYCDRPGWALATDTPRLAAVLLECRRGGARYVVVAGRPDSEGRVACPAAVAQYPEVARGEGYLVVDMAR